jgi:hypothetical protein
MTVTSRKTFARGFVVGGIMLCLAASQAIVPRSADAAEKTAEVLAENCRLAIQAIEHRAEFANVNELKTVINRIARCVFYLEGFSSGFMQASGLEGPPLAAAVGYCEPVTVNYEDRARVIIDWVDSHPDQRDLPQSKAVHEAFLSAWPC